jgi:CDP-4-dehydro-6-deoxyglucose reductase
MEKHAEITSIAEVAPEVLLIEAVMTEPTELAFRAGQFISVRVDAGGRVHRPYSIASTPDDRSGFELLVKLLPGGVASTFVRGLHAGDSLDFSGPQGFFTCDPAHPGDVVFAVTGVGMAAALPLAATTLARPDETRPVRLYWGLRHAEDVFWRDRLDALAAASPRFSYEIFLSSPGAGWPGAQGRITSHLLDALPSLSQPTFYAVGNGAMIQELKKELVARGIDRKKQFHSEQFYGFEEP